MIINLNRQANLYPAMSIMPVKVFTGSAVPFEIEGVPAHMSMGHVTGFKISITNADGVTVTADCEKKGHNWCATFAASNFTNYGFTSKGARFIAVLTEGPEETPVTHETIIAIGDLEVIAAEPTAQPGDPSAHYQVKGDDEYHKSEIVDGVQHYKKMAIAYDAEMAAWGFNLEGDYILSNGSFVPAN